MGLTLVTPPAVEPITLEEAKAHLRVTGSTDDAVITALISAARAYVDGPTGYLQRAVVQQSWRWTLPALCRYQHIPLPSLIDVVSVRYLDSDATEQTIDPDSYIILTDREPGVVIFDSIPVAACRPDAFRITFTAGYSSTDSPADYAAAVPPPIKHAMLLLVGHWFENREGTFGGSMTELPMGVNALLAPYRLERWIIR